MNDNEIIDMLRTDADAGFREIVAQRQHMVYSMARSFLHDSTEAEDTAQEVFLKIFRGIGSFRAEAKLSTWIYRITVTTCMNAARKKKRSRSVPMDDAHLPAAAPHEIDETRSAVRAAIAKLPEQFRAVVLLKDMEDKSYKEIAAILRLPIGTVESRLHRARMLIRESLGAEDRYDL